MECFATSETKWKVLFGIGLLAGVLALIVGVGTPLVLTYPYRDIFEKQIKSYIVVNSKGSDRFHDWATYYSYTNPYYVSFYFWNLTNPAAALNRTLGVKPSYSAVGPYVYRRYRIKQNVAFLADDQSVQYQDNQWFVWSPEQSTGSETDTITNLNPAYLKLMNELGGEYRLQLAISGTELNQIVEFMNTTFVDDYTANAYGEVLNVAVPALVQQLNASLGNYAGAEKFFYSYWANGTAPPPIFADWDGMLLWQGNPEIIVNPNVRLSYPSGISMNSTRALFDPAVPNSLLNSTRARDGGPWAAARTSNQTQQMLMQQFNLSTIQVSTILFWLENSFRQFRAVPYLLKKYDVPNITDVAYLQWGSALPLQGHSVRDMYPSRFSRGAPEVAFQPNVPKIRSNGNIPYDIAKVFLSGPYGVTTPQNVLLFIDEFAQLKPNFTRWGFTSGDSAGPDTALSYIINFVAINYTMPDLLASLAQGGNIITTRSVHDILWNCTDPTMEMVFPGQTCSLFMNNTLSPINVIDCGCNNISAIEQYVTWHNMTEIVDVWSTPKPVVGSSKSGQFPPFLKDDTRLQYWEGSILRPIGLQKVAEVDNTYDIKVWKYGIANQEVFPNTTDYTETVAGFANMTAWHPMGLYYSDWDMWGVPAQNSTNLVDGLDPTSPDEDATSIEIEPITGIAMGWKQRLQMNVLVPPGASKKWMYMYHPLFADGIFYPLLKYADDAQINAQQAQQWKDKVEMLLWYQNFFFWFSLGLGILLFVIFVVSVSVGGGCLWKIHKEKQGYDRFFHSSIINGGAGGGALIRGGTFLGTDPDPYPDSEEPSLPSPYLSGRGASGFMPRGFSPLLNHQPSSHHPHHISAGNNRHSRQQRAQHRQHPQQQQQQGRDYDSSNSERTISAGDLYLSD